VWLFTTSNASQQLAGTIARVRISSSNPNQVDVVVQLDSSGVTVVDGAACGRTWGLERRRSPRSPGEKMSGPTPT